MQAPPDCTEPNKRSPQQGERGWLRDTRRAIVGEFDIARDIGAIVVVAQCDRELVSIGERGGETPGSKSRRAEGSRVRAVIGAGSLVAAIGKTVKRNF